ncbi:hypothetical protein EES39_33160 [Streptomyces sp. ADI92-24]|nr:hypothetical protein EES39_33160 [Streptomyces sp. ADI92-24]
MNKATHGLALSVCHTDILLDGLRRPNSLRDTGRAAESRCDYQHVADQDGRLAPAARRGLAHAARLAGDFPTALAAAQNLGWEGRHQRVLGDLYWLQGQPERAAAAYLAGRGEADQHGKAGEAAHCQALRASTINVRRAELIRDAAFHQAVLDDHSALTETIARLQEQTTHEDHAYFVDIAHFMADQPQPARLARRRTGDPRPMAPTRHRPAYPSARPAVIPARARGRT